MTAAASGTHDRGSAWFEHAVFALDRRLRRRQGVYEYTTDPECLFRVQRSLARQDLTLSDGTRIRRGDPVLALHLWNEQMPAMGREGATLAWAHRINRGIRTSLCDLAAHLRQSPELASVRAVCADMSLGTAEQSGQLQRMAARYGFEASSSGEAGRGGLFHHLGENILNFLLVLATNPAAARGAVLRRGRTLAYLSRASLARYEFVDREHR